MTSRRLVWLPVLLTILGGLLAHIGGAHHEAAELGSHSEETSWLPMTGSLFAAFILAVTATRPRQTSRRWLVLLPIAAWVIQEGLELVLGHESAPLGAAMEPHFLTGLLIQLPFVVAILALMRLLVRGGVAIIRRLRSLRVSGRTSEATSRWRPRQHHRPRPNPFARGSPPRAPPRLVVTA